MPPRKFVFLNSTPGNIINGHAARAFTDRRGILSINPNREEMPERIFLESQGTSQVTNQEDTSMTTALPEQECLCAICTCNRPPPIYVEQEAQTADPTFYLEIHSSQTSLRATLSRELMGQLHPVDTLTRRYKKGEKNYDSADKELLTIVQSFEKWCNTLQGTKNPIKILSPHCNLEYWKEPKRHHANWLEIMANFNFEIQYHKGLLEDEEEEPESPIANPFPDYKCPHLTVQQKEDMVCVTCSQKSPHCKRGHLLPDGESEEQCNLCAAMNDFTMPPPPLPGARPTPQSAQNPFSGKATPCRIAPKKN